MAHLGFIGGSGLYDLPGLEDVREMSITTPFGKPSGPIFTGRIGSQPVAFLARHGRRHIISPSEIPFRANIHALKQLGVDHIVSVSAVGSLREELPPGSAVLPSQIIDRTIRAERSFFDSGVVAHVAMADPFCNTFRGHINALAQGSSRQVTLDGTYICIEGPQFSTRAESHLFRSWGADIIGMTAMPEARLAREAGMCYALVAMVTDYDVWHESAEDVTVDVVLRVLEDNTRFGKELLHAIATSEIPACACNCASAMENALITNPGMMSAELASRIALLVKTNES